MTEPKTPRRRRTKAELSASQTTRDMIEALSWLAPAQSKKVDAAPYETHCLIQGGWVVAYNGMISAGHKINSTLTCAVHTERFKASLLRATDAGLSITSSDDLVQIHTESFASNVPTLSLDQVKAVTPDNPSIGLDDRLARAFDDVAPLAKEGATELVKASVRLDADGLVSATDRHTIMQIATGIVYPDVLIPRASADAFRKADGMYAMGFSDSSVTIWYGADMSRWIKTSFYKEEWPDIRPIFADWGALEFRVFPAALKDAIDAVLPHSPDGFVHFFKDSLWSDAPEHTWSTIAEHTSPKDPTTGARVDMPSMFAPPHVALNGERLLFVLKSASHYALDAASNNLLFYGDNMRGALAPSQDMGDV